MSLSLTKEGLSVQQYVHVLMDREQHKKSIEWPVEENNFIENTIVWKPQLTAIAIYRSQRNKIGNEISTTGHSVKNSHQCIGGQCTFREVQFDVYKFTVCSDKKCSLCSGIPVKGDKRLLPLTNAEFYWKSRQSTWNSFRRKHKIYHLFHVQNVFVCVRSSACHICDENCDQLEEKSEGVYICAMSGLEKHSVDWAWQERKRQPSIGDEIVDDIGQHNSQYRKNLSQYLGKAKKPSSLNVTKREHNPIELFGVKTHPMASLPIGFEEWYNEETGELICPEIPPNCENKESIKKVHQLRLKRELDARSTRVNEERFDITTGCARGLYIDYYPRFAKSLAILERNYPNPSDRKEPITRLVTQYKAILLDCMQMFFYRILFSQERRMNDIMQNDAKLSQLEQELVKHIKLSRRNKDQLVVQTLNMMAIQWWERNINKTPWNQPTLQVKEIILSYYPRKFLDIWFKLMVCTRAGLAAPSKLGMIPTCLALFCLCRYGLVQSIPDGKPITVLPVDTAVVSYLPPSEHFAKYRIQKRDINNKQLYIKKILEHESKQKDSQIHAFQTKHEHKTLLNMMHDAEVLSILEEEHSNKHKQKKDWISNELSTVEQ